MTKEELEKEAREYIAEHSEYSEVFEETFIAIDTLTAMVDFAEPREKQIQIDAEQIRALQKQNGELTDRVKELEAQLEREKNLNQCLSDHNEQLRELIEKMKNCRNCKNEKIEGACGHFTQVGWCKNWELAD